MKKKYLVVLLLLFSSNIYSQVKDHYWSIGINPLSFAESQMSVGPCIGYRVSRRIELWSEVSFIFHNSYMRQEWKKMTGARFILQPRYFTDKNRTFFITPEFRSKTFSFDNRLDLINSSTNDTLHNYSFRENQTFIGWAIVCGKQVIISRKRNIIMECTLGIGSKTRYIKRKNIPAGYEYKPYFGLLEFHIDYETNKYSTVSLPFGVRFIWNFE